MPEWAGHSSGPADLANTILKMADKRSYVGGTIKVTGASDVFEQDIEDLPEGVREQAGEIGAGKDKKITKKQLDRLFAIASQKGFGEEQIRANLAAKLNYEGSLKEMPVTTYDKLIAAFEKLPDKPKSAKSPLATELDTLVMAHVLGDEAKAKALIEDLSDGMFDSTVGMEEGVAGELLTKLKARLEAPAQQGELV